MNKKKIKSIGLIALLIILLTVACDPPSLVTHNLSVTRYTTSSLTNAEADSILADATNVLQTNDGEGDVACNVQFVRDGNVTVFSTGDGSIDSQAEFNTIIGLPEFVALVNQINWCGSLIPNVIGCAPVPGESLTVVRFTPALEGILWAHEFGHTRGLSHRNDDPNAVMNGTIGSTRRRVTQDECNAFRTAIASTAASEAGAMAIEAYVRQVFIHGIPYEEASGFGAANVPVLLAMLNDPAEEAHWANIVVVLNIIGGEEVVEPMIAFINEGSNGELTYAHYVAKTSALMSFGYLINRTGNEQALAYLIETANPEVWADRETNDIGPFQASVEESNRDLSKHAILGLALSGNPEAAEAMRTIQAAEAPGEQGAFQAQVTDIVSEALEANRMIAENGLVEYYRAAQP